MAILTVAKSGGNFTTIQAAVNAAVSGDTIKIQAGALFTEAVLLPDKGVLANYITITSDADPSKLPAAGIRINPSFAPFMPIVQSPSGGAAAFTILQGNHYKLQFIECRNNPQGFRAIIELGTGDTRQYLASQQPDSIIIDQCWIHGGVVCGQKRGIECDGTNITVSNCYISDIKSVGQDSQSIASFNATGPLTITNNYLSCGSYSYINGGGDPQIRTAMTVTGTPTTTSANVTCFEANHTLAELIVGHLLAVRAGGVRVFTTLRSVTGSGVSGSITYDALAVAPDVPGDMRQGANLRGLTFRKNWIKNDPLWILGAIPPVTGVTAVSSTASGTLAAGTWYYTVQAFSTGGYQGQTVHALESDEVSAVLAAPGRVTVAWTEVTGATTYRVWRGTTTTNQVEYVEVPSTSLSKIDDGSLTFIAAVPAAGTVLDIKNLFELKGVVGAQVDSNVFENHWKGSDSGYAFWCKSNNQDGTDSYAQTRDVVFELNIMRHIDGFLNAHAQEVPQGSGFDLPEPATSIMIRNNLIYDSGTPTWKQGLNHYAISLQGKMTNLTLDHNTIVHVGAGLMATDSAGQPHPISFVMTNNLIRGETFGIHDAFGTGKAALDVAAPGYVFAKNAMSDANTPQYPVNNFYATAAAWEAEFTAYTVDGVNANYKLKTASPWHLAGTDGKDIGCDVAAVLAATADVAGDPGTPPGTPDPIIIKRAYRHFRRFRS